MRLCLVVCLQVLDVALDAKSGRIATASADSTARVWDLKECELISVMKGHRGEISRVNLSPVSGEFAVTSSQDHTARLWSVTTGNCVQVLDGHSDEVFACVFSSCGKKVISASKDNTAIIWG